MRKLGILFLCMAILFTFGCNTEKPTVLDMCGEEIQEEYYTMLNAFQGYVDNDYIDREEIKDFYNQYKDLFQRFNILNENEKHIQIGLHYASKFAYEKYVQTYNKDIIFIENYIGLLKNNANTEAIEEDDR